MVIQEFVTCATKVGVWLHTAALHGAQTGALRAEADALPLLNVVRLPGDEARIHESCGQEQGHAGCCKDGSHGNGRQREGVYEAP